MRDNNRGDGITEEAAAYDNEVWADVLGETDRMVFEAAGWGRRAGFGRRPALMIVDVNYNFCGDRPEPILESIERWRYSCGEVAWTTAIPAIARLLEVARRKRLPVIYTTNPRRPDGFDLGVWTSKSTRSDDVVDVKGHLGNRIVAEVAPQSDDIVVEKRKPSAFFGTPLMSHLTMLGADSLIITGTTTSGCVRATAVDAISYDLRVTIPHEAVFDRAVLSHKVSLMDIHMKYADVTNLDEVLGHLEGLNEGMFDDVYPPAAARASSG
ncbi:isochorismatase family protein [Micromonospora sp. Llam7]|uniref:isochorismatase family protein n=1 Tax=Micromonospora tarapacensis TaxID=2835305 RepID=UPI001C83D32E|nr:isochorismatase family protein [Micromonospora tarapacensis]MBX7269069.1 isochorismatase family protein [Micromonospora tarapacensis]